MLKTPKGSEDYILAQRTDYKKRGSILDFGKDLYLAYEEMVPFLPHGTKDTFRILDIGSGMGGIDVFLSRHYAGKAEITLLDKEGDPNKVTYGFVKNGDDVSPYSNFDRALELLSMNSVDLSKIHTHDITQKPFPDTEFNLVISLISWGFHYPISTYAPKLVSGGVIIADVRKGTDGMEALSEMGDITIINEKSKSFLLACQT